jgi:gluconate 2-dehydrogenase alpha chain
VGLQLASLRPWTLDVDPVHISGARAGGGSRWHEPIQNNWYGLPAQGVAVDNFDHAGLDFIGGGNLWVYSDRRPTAAASMPTFGKAPTWGSAWKAFVKENADRWNSVYIQKTTLPYEDNYLDLDPTVQDPLGTMGLSTHAYGGTRMGDNPETNLVNRWGFSHEAPNLGILGASVMGTSGTHNSTLTA